jgi:hypothetical protein
MGLLWLGLCLSEREVFAAFELSPVGPRGTALGAAGCALSGEAVALFRNPALLAEGATGAGFLWSQQYGLPELTREAVGTAFRVHDQPLGVRAGSLGNDLYRESEFGLVAARAIRPELSAGLEISSKWLDIRGCPVSQVWTLTAGVVGRPVPNVALGAVWTNLNSPRLPGYRDRLPESLIVGIAAEITRNSVIVADIVQEKSFPAEYRFGAEAGLLSGFRLRIGARAEPVRPSAGFQVDIGRWEFSYAGDLHPDLGASHELGLEFHFRP